MDLVFDTSLHYVSKIPDAFVWPEALSSSSGASSLSSLQSDEGENVLDMPSIDLSCFRGSNSQDVAEAAKQVARAGHEFGFFHVVNHGVDQGLIEKAHRCSQAFFNLPFPQKQRIKRAAGESFGYTSSFTGRFRSRLPWKETLSLQPTPVSNIADYFGTGLGDSESSEVYQEYTEEMVRVGLEIVELLGEGLGCSFTKYFYPTNSSIMRLNYYPPCQQPSLTFGTGPHTDPTGLTILHQDDVKGLQVHRHDQWWTVLPRRDAFVVNIGDTFMALSNQYYRSCLHRAIVNRRQPRQSLAFFLNPSFDMVVTPPPQLLDNPRIYHDFTWRQFLHFTQTTQRCGISTLDLFDQWLQSNK